MNPDADRAVKFFFNPNHFSILPKGLSEGQQKIEGLQLDCFKTAKLNETTMECRSNASRSRRSADNAIHQMRIKGKRTGCCVDIIDFSFQMHFSQSQSTVVSMASTCLRTLRS